MGSVKKSAGRGKSPSTVTQRELWARSAGVCYYPGCAEVLYRDATVYWEPINLGELAHNVASSSNGPRGDSVRSAELSDNPDNLLMLCRKHHKTADALAREYREATLKIWKERHEIAVLTAAQMTLGETVMPFIVAATQIGGQEVHVNEIEVVRTILAEGRVPSAKPYRVTLDTAAQPDDQTAYWAAQVHTLRDELRLLGAHQKNNKSDAPLGVFALAEMPTLMALGHALGDKRAIRIYQYSRHIDSWAFQNPNHEKTEFDYGCPSGIGEHGVAIGLSLTAPIDEARIRKVLPNTDIPIIHFTTPNMSTELVQSEHTIAEFRRAFRECLSTIENTAPQSALIHLFLCMPPSLAVAAGTCVMPKVSNPIFVYDAKGAQGEFHHRLTLPLPLTPHNTSTSYASAEGNFI